MKKLLILIVTFGLFTACNDNKGLIDQGDRNTGNKDRKGHSWSKRDRNQWMKVCGDAMNNDPRSSDICSCVLGKLEKKYASLDDADREGGEAAGKKLTQECLGANDRENSNDDDGYDDEEVEEDN